MTFKGLQARADRLAKQAMVYIPLLFVVTAVVILCVSAKAEWLPAALFLDLAGCFMLLVLALIPSYLMDIWDALKPRDFSKSEIIHQLAEKLGLPVIDVKLSEMDPSDLKGLPENS